MGIEVPAGCVANEVQAVRRLVRGYNRAHSSVADARELVVVARDAQGVLVGGAAGETWGEVFELEYLGVSEPWRRQGVGSRILACAEAEARARGCRRVVLDTYSFQAPDFYPAHGYREVTRVVGFGDGAAKHFFAKELEG
ncbi:MAG: GNAT family N-acetyltransferase [Gaiellales bacterium]|nr:GNAT family N-acetyltransferase [Gaiellales bacterium]